jgi:hypothetical protein
LKDLEIINPDELIKMKEVLSLFKKDLNSWRSYWFIL